MKLVTLPLRASSSPIRAAWWAVSFALSTLGITTAIRKTFIRTLRPPWRFRRRFENLDLILCISFIFKSSLGPCNLAAVMLPGWAPSSWYRLHQFISAYWSRAALLRLVTHGAVFHSWDGASFCPSKCVCVCAHVCVNVWVYVCLTPRMKKFLHK